MAGLFDDGIVVIKEEMDDDTKQIAKHSDTLNFLQEESSVYRNLSDGQNPFCDLSEQEFRKSFRLSKEKTFNLLEMVKNDLSFLSKRNQPIPPHIRLLTALRFLATGDFQMTDGDLMSIHQSTVCRIIHQVSRAIAGRRSHFMRFPSPEEQAEEKLAFFSEAGFPKVIGLVDGTHVKITSPGGKNAEMYRNHKNVFSINVQLACNSRMEFIHIVARWPGSTHDSHVFESSTLPERVANTNSVLLGDAGYPLLPYLMTPIQRPSSEAEESYNKSHITTRTKIKRAFGVWKRKFACLTIPMRTKLENTLPIIVAAACLHNYALSPDDLEFHAVDEDLMPAEHQGVQSLAGRAIRQQIVNNYFT